MRPMTSAGTRSRSLGGNSPDTVSLNPWDDIMLTCRVAFPNVLCIGPESTEVYYTLSYRMNSDIVSYPPYTRRNDSGPIANLRFL